jgi:NDP-sugar pyrophosphorylase family protein
MPEAASLSRGRRADRTSLAALDALVLAGGLGTRLREAVADRPKVLAPVAGTPFIMWLLRHLGAQGLRRAILCTGHGAEAIECSIGPRVAQVSVRYARERDPLGTGGALRAALSMTPSDPVLVLNGDSLLAAPLAAFVGFHETLGAGAASLALVAAADAGAGARVELDASNRVASFEEKGRRGPGLLHAGVVLAPRARLEAIPVGRTVSLEREVLPGWIAEGLWGWRSRSRLLDIGTPSAYRRAEEFLGEVGLL